MSPFNPNPTRNPQLTIDTSNVDDEFFRSGRVSLEITTPSPTAEGSLSLHPRRGAPSPSGDKQPKSPVPSRQPANRALKESRKLLAHLLSQLRDRPTPPPIFDTFKNNLYGYNERGFVELVETVKGVMKFKAVLKENKGGSPAPATEDEENEQSDAVFTTDVTFGLMAQLKDVLIVSLAQGWQVFYDDSSAVTNPNEQSGRLPSPFRRSRQGTPGPGLRSKSPSPAGRAQLKVPDLLSQCIAVLASVVQEDCRYKISSPRPFRPPNFLQALTLDVAQYLIYSNRKDPKIVSQIGFALIPAFATFDIAMQPRLLTFFEQVVLRGVLDDLRGFQNPLKSRPNSIDNTDYEKDDQTDLTGLPVVSIQVDKAQDDFPTEADTNAHWTPWSSSSSIVHLRSSNTPLQPLSVYYLGSLTTPLLAAIFENIDLTSYHNSQPDTFHRFCRLIDMIVSTKMDSYLNILEVVAYHTSKARHSAVSVLATFWPRAVGHVVISNPLPLLGFVLEVDFAASAPSRSHPYAHQFVPWRFASGTKNSRAHAGCSSCLAPINGFGLFCPYCMCGVHFDCYDYPDGIHTSEYTLKSDPGKAKLAMYRFCHILPSRRDRRLPITSASGHTYRPVNLFTLSVCAICRGPTWGCTTQALKCDTCAQFVHPSCIASASQIPSCQTTNGDSSYLTINFPVLRASFIDNHKELLLSSEEILKRTFEEISVFQAILWIQLQLMDNGLALGSISVRQGTSNERKVSEFELHSTIRLYDKCLSLSRLPLSGPLDEYFQVNDMNSRDRNFMFDWPSLVFISSSVKSPFDAQNPYASNSADLLNVTLPDSTMEQQSIAPQGPFEVVSLSHLRNCLGYEYRMFSDAAAKLLLSYLHHLGFFERSDSELLLFDEPRHQGTTCIFPLPLGLDLSADVETLVSAVDACLSDLDLSVNEFGFLLLVRRFWPNGMASEYASRRLARSVLSWMLAEDSHLATILRDYVAKKQTLPGVLIGPDLSSWPFTKSSRVAPSSSMHNGGDYVATRRALIHRYAAQWLSALHDQDPSAYSHLLYQLVVELAQDSTIVDNTLLEAKFDSRNNAREIDEALRTIVKLYQFSLTFSIIDDLLLRWLESLSSCATLEEQMPSLQRLFSREFDMMPRATFADAASADNANVPAIDPWRLIVKAGSIDSSGLTNSLKWLYIFSRSGVDIPVVTFMEFSSLVNSFDAPLSDCLLLVRSAMSSSWLRSIGRQEILAIFPPIHSRIYPRVLDAIASRTDLANILLFLRQSLAACLLLYGCDRNLLLSLGLVIEDDISGLPSRRKLNTRGSSMPDPVIIDAALMLALERYVNANLDEMTCLVAKFFKAFLIDSPFLEAYEVDNFILRNGELLSDCAWRFYEIQAHDLSSIRASFLLRVVCVDSAPFQGLLASWFQPSSNWESRLVALTRLFRIILDVTSPFFDVEDHQWRSSITDVFFYFFNCLWADEKEEIRLAVDTWSQTLLPAHFRAISLCWDECLAKAPIVERVKLISFLLQLRPHFPSWKVLSWTSIIETLLEDEYEQKNGGNEDGPASAHLSMYGLSSSNDKILKRPKSDPDMALLRVSIVLLSLQMIADGIDIDTFSLLRIKVYTVQVIGFDDASLVPEATGHTFHVRFGEVTVIQELSYPCVNEILPVLDAYHMMDLTPSSVGVPNAGNDEPSRLLVGSVLVEVVLVMFCGVQDLQVLPILTIKSLLESLIVIIYKHDLESRALSHLQGRMRAAVRRALGLTLLETSYEVRQLALSVPQAYIKRSSTLSNSFICEALECAAKLINSQNLNGQDILVAQAKSFMETTLAMHPSAFSVLCRRHLDRHFFLNLKQTLDSNVKATASTESLRDTLLRETLGRAVENDYNALQTVLNNLLMYVELVHHQAYSADSMQFVGMCLASIVRRASEWAATVFDPNPLLLLPAILIQHNKSQSRDLLLSTETVFRVVLARFYVSSASIARLLQVVSSLYRKTQPKTQSQQNIIAVALFDVLGDGLRHKIRVWPSTLTSMLEAITSTDNLGSQTFFEAYIGSYLGLADAGVQFLQTHRWSDVNSEDDFSACIRVANLVLEAASHGSDGMERLLLYQTIEKSNRAHFDVRAWNILVLAALMNQSKSWASMMFGQLQCYSQTHYEALRPYLQPGAGRAESAAIDINHAYVAIKLWMMLAQQLSDVKVETHTPLSRAAPQIAHHLVWNELWPPFERLVNVFEADAQGGFISQTLTTVTWSSVADLFVFLRQLRSPLILETPAHISILKRLLNMSGESTKSKIVRSLQSMADPPADVTFEMTLSQTAKEVVAAEKLAALEAKLAAERRAIPERYRRDARIPT